MAEQTECSNYSNLPWYDYSSTVINTYIRTLTIGAQQSIHAHNHRCIYQSKATRKIIISKPISVNIINKYIINIYINYKCTMYYELKINMKRPVHILNISR